MAVPVLAQSDDETVWRTLVDWARPSCRAAIRRICGPPTRHHKALHADALRRLAANLQPYLRECDRGPARTQRTAGLHGRGPRSRARTRRGQGRNSVFDYGTAQWDLIVITYQPFPVSGARYVLRLLGALPQGGLVVMESFASDRGAASRCPVDIDPADLLRAMLGFRIPHFDG